MITKLAVGGLLILFTQTAFMEVSAWPLGGTGKVSTTKALEWALGCEEDPVSCNGDIVTSVDEFGNKDVWTFRPDMPKWFVQVLVSQDYKLITHIQR